MVVCYYPGCYKSRRKKDYDDLRTFHSFPADKKRKLEWIRRIGGYESDILPYGAKVCSLHFPNSAYVSHHRLTLKPNALPRAVNSTRSAVKPNLDDSPVIGQQLPITTPVTPVFPLTDAPAQMLNAVQDISRVQATTTSNLLRIIPSSSFSLITRNCEPQQAPLLWPMKPTETELTTASQQPSTKPVVITVEDDDEDEDEPSIYVCLYCYRVFTADKLLRIHRKQNHPDIKSKKELILGLWHVLPVVKLERFSLSKPPTAEERDLVETATSEMDSGAGATSNNGNSLLMNSTLLEEFIYTEDEPGNQKNENDVAVKIEIEEEPESLLISESVNPSSRNSGVESLSSETAQILDADAENELPVAIEDMKCEVIPIELNCMEGEDLISMDEEP